MVHDESRTRLDLAARVAARYGGLAQVEAVVLSGSLANALSDAGSDIDLYVYSTGDLPLPGPKSATASSNPATTGRTMRAASTST